MAFYVTITIIIWSKINTLSHNIKYPEYAILFNQNKNPLRFLATLYSSVQPENWFTSCHRLLGLTCILYFRKLQSNGSYNTIMWKKRFLPYSMDDKMSPQPGHDSKKPLAEMQSLRDEAQQHPHSGRQHPPAAHQQNQNRVSTEDYVMQYAMHLVICFALQCKPENVIQL